MSAPGEHTEKTLRDCRRLKIFPTRIGCERFDGIKLEGEKNVFSSRENEHWLLNKDNRRGAAGETWRPAAAQLRSPSDSMLADGTRAKTGQRGR